MPDELTGIDIPLVDAARSILAILYHHQDGREPSRCRHQKAELESIAEKAVKKGNLAVLTSIDKEEVLQDHA